MGLEVVVGAVGDALKLRPLASGKEESILDIHGSLRVVRELFFRVLEESQIVRVQAEVDVPIPAVLQPVLMPFFVRPRLDEEFHFHLLEFTGPENEIARRYFVAETLPGLPDTERRLLACGVHHVEVIHEDALRGLRAQVMNSALVLDGTDHRAEHAVEVLRLGEVALSAAVGTYNLRETLGWFVTVLLGECFDQLIRPPTFVALLALGERIDERIDMTRRDPHLRGKDNRRINADHIVAPTHHVLPPLPAHVLFELDSQRAVVPGRAGAAVDLRRRENKSPTLGEIDDGIYAGSHKTLHFRSALRASTPAGCRRTELSVRVSAQSHT